jgi:nicotinate-nucleotide adenylyltransferase
MSRPRRIGLLGGTFDPIHLGHLALAAAARTALGLDEIRVVPSHVPPHRPQPGASVYHRFAMAALAVADDPHLLLDDIEAQSDRPSYTAITLRHLHATGLAASQIFFIAGADAFAEIATWRDYPRVLDEAHFAIVSRAGRTASSLRTTLPELAPRMRTVAVRGDAGTVDTSQPSILLIDADIPPISSTSIRRDAVEGRTLNAFVPARVGDYITRHRLYRTPSLTNGPDDAARELHEQESV